jgi:hypothetical protein
MPLKPEWPPGRRLKTVAFMIGFVFDAYKDRKYPPYMGHD